MSPYSSRSSRPMIFSQIPSLKRSTQLRLKRGCGYGESIPMVGGHLCTMSGVVQTIIDTFIRRGGDSGDVDYHRAYFKPPL
jgi:hypothetical protein